jgi:hypothetical protein
MVLGAKHVESPFIEFGQISTVIYFAHFLIIVPLVSTIENSLMDLSISQKNNLSNGQLLAGFSIPVFILITIGTIGGELGITISTNIDMASIIDTTIKTSVGVASGVLSTGLDLFTKSIPFMVDKSLELIVYPVLSVPASIPVITLESLPSLLTQINNMNIEFADLLREYVNLADDIDASLDYLNDLSQRILVLRENIGELLRTIRNILENFGVTFTPVNIVEVDLSNTEIPVIPIRNISFNSIDNQLAINLAVHSFNVLEFEFAKLLEISMTEVSPTYSGVYV